MFFQKYFRSIVIALLALLYLGSVWQRPLYIDTEFRQAEIAREMMATAPMPEFCGELLPGEPPLVHWVNAAVMALTGEQPAAVRLAGALATLLTAGVIFLLGRRSGVPRLAEAAALVWLFSAAVFAAGTSGGGDALFVFFNTLTLAMFFFAATESALARRCAYLALCGVGWALAMLCRGAEALPMAVIPAAVFLVWRKEWKSLLVLPWVPLAVAALIVAGCAMACRVNLMEWFPFPPEAAGGGTFPLAWLILPFAGTLPWILFLPMVWHGYRIDFAGAGKISLLRFALCMLLMGVVVPFFPAGGAAFRFLPCLPAAAILFAFGMLRASDRGDYWWVNRGMNLLVWCLLPFPLLLFLLQTLAKFTRRVPSELVVYRFHENYYLPVVALMVMVIWFRMASREPGGARKFGCFCIGLAFLFLSAPVSMPWRFVRDFAPEAFLRQVAVPRAAGDTAVLANGSLRAAAAWTLKRSDVGTLEAMPVNGGVLELPRERGLLVITDDEAQVRRMPAPKTTYRAGGVFVVHYPGSSGGAK